MKAIGVDSLSYKSLFVVKYIAFAILGGIIGMFAGIPLGKFMVSKFVVNTLNPDKMIVISLGVISCIVFVLLMILFSFTPKAGNSRRSCHTNPSYSDNIPSRHIRRR